MTERCAPLHASPPPLPCLHTGLIRCVDNIIVTIGYITQSAVECLVQLYCTNVDINMQ